MWEWDVHLYSISNARASITNQLSVLIAQEIEMKLFFIFFSFTSRCVMTASLVPE